MKQSDSLKAELKEHEAEFGPDSLLGPDLRAQIAIAERAEKGLYSETPMQFRMRGRSISAKSAKK